MIFEYRNYLKEQMMTNNMFSRFLELQISKTLDFSRVTAVIGPRQAGKTTLVNSFTSDDRQFFTLDDHFTYEQASIDPIGFVRRVDRCCIDEIQRIPDLIRAIKMSVDADSRPGRFLITGSADILTIPTISESLAGRMVVHTLFPLTQSEIEGKQTLSIDDLISGNLKIFAKTSYIKDALEKRVLRGGYPDVCNTTSEDAKKTWTRSYIETMLRREIKDISSAYKFVELSKFIEACAIQTSQLVEYSSIARDMKLDVKTVQKYIDILEQMYILRRLPSWHNNELKRLIKSPKIHFIDSGLAATIRQIELSDVIRDRSLFGTLLESFVFSELLKMSTWSQQRLTFFHYRDKQRNEVDIVITNGRQDVVGLEVKASDTLSTHALKGMKKLQNSSGERFKAGYVFYTGNQIIPMADNILAVPVSALWEKPS